MNCKLCLVSAPAGYGKSTLLANWIEEQQLPCAWISLDEKDNDPARFFTYLTAGLQSIQLEVDDKLISTFQESNTDINESFLMPLINQISEADGQYVLVLDDYHLIQNQTIHTAMIFLLDHLPRNMHILIATRSDPPLQLAKMRARGELVEIRVNDLRFTAGEVVNFLNQRMRLDLSTEDISILTQKTEGWVVGLQLAGITLQKHNDKHGFVITFAGDDRYIADYLIDEALKHQSQNIHDFLLKTSILETFNAPLCDAVTGVGNSQSIIEELELANLFLIPLDHQRNWYRYHHLFAGLLQQRLGHTFPSEDISNFHSRASKWLSSKDFIFEALSHAFAADDIETVVRLIEINGFSLLDRGEIVTLINWINKIPADVRQSRPWIKIAEGWVLGYAGKLKEGEDALNLAEESLVTMEESEEKRASGHIFAIRAYINYVHGNGEVAVSHATKALDLLPEDDLSVRAFSAYTLGEALMQCNDLKNAAIPLLNSITWAQAAGNDHVYTLASGSLAFLYMIQGKLNQSELICQDVIEHVDCKNTRKTPAMFQIYKMMTDIHYFQNELDEALRYGQEGLEISKYWGQFESIIAICVSLTYVLIAQNKFDQAEEVMALANRPGMFESPWMNNFINKSKAMIQLANGNLTAASQWAEEYIQELQDEIEQSEWAVTRAAAQILIAQNKFAEAYRLLDKLITGAGQSGGDGYLNVMLPMQSVVLMELGKQDQALDILRESFKTSEPEGFIREYISQGEPMAKLLRLAIKRNIRPKFAAELLLTIQQDQNLEPASKNLTQPTGSIKSYDVPESLSPRELEVLQLIAGGCTNQEIAQELYLSLYTVKSHARNIFGKLGVKNRTEAVAKARLFGLLPQD